MDTDINAFYRMPAGAQALVVKATGTMAAATASDTTEMITPAMASERYAAIQGELTFNMPSG